MFVDCPAAPTKGLAGGRARKQVYGWRGKWGRGWEGHFLYDAFICAMSSLQSYNLKPMSTFGLVLFCLVLLQTFCSHFGGTEISSKRAGPARQMGFLRLTVPSWGRSRRCTVQGSLQVFPPLALYIQPHISCLQRVSPDPKLARP